MLAPSTVIDDRRGHVRGAEKIRRPHADALAADDVHAVVDDLPRALGEMQLGDARQHRRLLAQIHRRGGQHAGRLHHVQVAADAGERLLDAFELADRHLELLAHARITADGARDELGHSDAGRRQRNAAPGGQAFHQHPPAAPEHRLPADHPVHRYEHVLAPVRAVLEHRGQRHVAAARLHARMRRRDQRAGDADVVLVAGEVIGIVGAERETEQRRVRRQRDVALVPRDARGPARSCRSCSPQHTMPKSGIDAASEPGRRVGEREARQLEALGEARQVMPLLCFGAVMREQLARPQRVRHHHRNGERGRVRRQLDHHARMRVRRKALAAVFLRDARGRENPCP